MTYVPMKLSFTENDLTKPCLRLDLRKCGYALDILTSVAGLDFATAYRNQETASQSGIAIPVSAKMDLIFIKRKAASEKSRREKELRDIAFLESLRM